MFHKIEKSRQKLLPGDWEELLDSIFYMFSFLIVFRGSLSIFVMTFQHFFVRLILYAVVIFFYIFPPGHPDIVDWPSSCLLWVQPTHSVLSSPQPFREQTLPPA